MDDSSKIREQLLEELHTFRQRLMTLETLTAERQQYAEALQESQARCALAVQAGQVGVWDWDLITGEIYLDPVLKEMLGYRDDEILNHLDDWSKRVHPDDLAAVMTTVQAALAGTDSPLRNRAPHAAQGWQYAVVPGTWHGIA